MPKMKTNRTAYKKVRRIASGKIKRGQAYKSHNTALKTPKRRRQLRGMILLDKTNERGFFGMLPYLK